MRLLIDSSKRHSVVAFYLLAFAITWGLGFSWGAILERNQFLLLPLAFVATCGPALAGILVSGVTNTRPAQGPRRTFWIALLAAWLVSALVCLANAKFVQHRPLSPAVIGLFTVAVAPVAFVLASARSRNPSVRDFLGSLIRLRGAWGWSLVGLSLFPALHVASGFVDSLLGARPGPPRQLPQMGLGLVGLIVVKFLYQFFFFNGVGEETGWRGFVLPRLQARNSPLVAALVIALFWVPWHFFLWRAAGAPVRTLSFWVGQYSLHVPSSLFIVWIFNRSRGSILVAGIAHAAANTVMAFLPLQDVRGLYLTWSAAALVMILADRMWKRLPADHPAVCGPPDRVGPPGASPAPLPSSR